MSTTCKKQFHKKFNRMDATKNQYTRYLPESVISLNTGKE